MQVEVQVQWKIDQEEDNATESSPDPLIEMLQQSRRVSEQTWQLWFQQWFNSLEPDISPIQSYELSLLLTDDAGIQALNACYRHQDRPTDVLAFATLDQASQLTALWSEMPIELGDIIISVETAAQQAQEQQHSLIQELVWLATHGLLHLLGWDHPDAEQLKLMLAQQEILLKLVDLPIVAG